MRAFAPSVFMLCAAATFAAASNDSASNDEGFPMMARSVWQAPPKGAPEPGLKTAAPVETSAPDQASVAYGASAIKPASFSQNAFTPDISLIVDLGFLNRNIDDVKNGATYVPGFNPAVPHTLGDAGFALNYAELAIASAVDPFFDLQAIFHLRPDSFEIEEAYVTTRNLPAGLQAKFGRFFSGFGRINSQHSHSWDFADKPIILDTLFGPEGLRDVGAQVNWLAPAPFYLSLDAEAFNGDNAEGSFARDAFDIQAGGVSKTIAKKSAPNALVTYAKTSVDIGALSLLGGVSYAAGRYQRALAGEAFDASSRVTGLDLFAKYYFAPHEYLSFQAEHLDRLIDGDSYANDAATAGTGFNSLSSVTLKQAGYYAQLVWRLNQSIALGGRYEAITGNDVSVAGAAQSAGTDLNKYSLMAQYNWSEFAFARLQYNVDRTKFVDGLREPVNEALVQFNFAVGPHPAHSF